MLSEKKICIKICLFNKRTLTSQQLQVFHLPVVRTSGAAEKKQRNNPLLIKSALIIRIPLLQFRKLIMSKLRIQRGALRRLFTRTHNELKEEAIQENEEKAAIATLWKRLEDRYQQLNKVDDEIVRELRETEDVSEQDMDEEIMAVQEYRDKWNDLCSLIIPSTQNSRGSSVSHDNETSDGISGNSSSTSNGSRSRYKLPKLKLVEFNGSPKEWLNF